MVEIAECFEPPISQKIHEYQKRKNPRKMFQKQLLMIIS